jgi:hypothetical protein
MNALAPYIAALHQQDLLDQAELRRRVRLFDDADPDVPGWRRGLGSGARGLSGLFASVARAIDPTDGAERKASRSSNGPGARAMAA